MSANPWDKFFWNDWENDPALRLCSLSAQGLWMRCLCICAKAEPKGFLVVAGRPLSTAELAKLVGVHETEVEALLAELSLAGVFSRDRKGRVFSRRMVRDENRRLASQKGGKKGGGVTYAKQTGIFGTQDPTQEGTQHPYAISQKPESSSGEVSVPPTNSESVASGAKAPRRSYAFEGRVIRVTQADYDRWREAYSAIRDLRAELTAADDYYAERVPKDGKLFFAVSSWLKRANTEALAPRDERRAVGAPPGATLVRDQSGKVVGFQTVAL